MKFKFWKKKKPRRTLEELSDELKQVNEERYRAKVQKNQTSDAVIFLHKQLEDNNFGQRVYELMKGTQK